MIRRSVRWLMVAAGLALPSRVHAQTPEFDFAKLGEEATGLLQQYLRIDTSNPPGNELATARFLHELLDKEGIENQILDTLELPAGRANFFARLRGDGSKKAIALIHHMDVVPVSKEYWSVDAFAGTIKDGFLYGRGTIDMKSQGIVQVMALLALKRAGVPLHRDIVLIANADEEDAGLGSRTFIARHPDLLKDVEYSLTEGDENRLENGQLKWWAIEVGEKRTYWQRLTVNGPSSHGSQPVPGMAVPKLARAIVRLSEWETPLHLTPGVAGYFKAQSKFYEGEQRQWLADAATAIRDPRARAWLVSDPARNALLRNTATPTVLAASSKVNTIGPVATAEVDVRLLPGQDTLVMKRALMRVIGDTSVHLTTIGDVPPNYDAPLNTDLYRALSRTMDRLRPGVPVAPVVDAGSSDKPYYAQAGIISYGVMPFLFEHSDYENGVHGNDERIAVDNIGFGVRFYLNTLIEAQ
ncbi:MAG TPA: M20/M25/M40 family metallo-hydrolase [Gemmatimonadales bacterium]|nr:M20/M25/M40 family metallo-hydrolase [Gemmatimonadales bacterium]